MTNAMEDVLYDRKNFNFDMKTDRHPLHVTERHFIYHLKKNVAGFLKFINDQKGMPLRSPRRLREIAIFRVVTDIKNLKRHPKWSELPGNVYPLLLTEAILVREAHAVTWLVSMWPTRVMRVHDVIPLEDILDDDYMSQPVEKNSKMTVVDCFVLGLLKLKPTCNLKFVDFSGFEKDRKLCRELSRLPILWMKPENRTMENIHDSVSDTLDITKDKVQRFLNRISVVYSNIDDEFKHGNKIDKVTVFLDLQILLDDVPIGLSLQHLSPFRFSCSRLWMTPIKDVGLSPCAISVLIDYKRITHFEYRDANLPTDDDGLSKLLTALPELPNLFCVSLPSSIDVNENPKMTKQVHNVILKLRYLQRLNFSYCNLKGNLSGLLHGLSQRLNYLNLKDCRLNEEDILFLIHWRPLHMLRELDLSYNDLAGTGGALSGLLEHMPYTTCFSLACCSLNQSSIFGIATTAKECARLKILSVQGYIPLSEEAMIELINIGCQVPTLQRLQIFPPAYAFPGENEYGRELNKLQALSIAYNHLKLKKRPDITLE